MSSFDISYMCDGDCKSFDNGYCHVTNQFLKVRNNFYIKTSYCLSSFKYSFLDYQNLLESIPRFNNKKFLLILNKK
jgi:hypothetical protein